MPILISRAQFPKNIIVEYAKPSRQSNKVMIICDGMPSVPSKKTFIEFWAKKGYWVFHPRYRGSWESGGTFLEYSPEEDIDIVIKQIPLGFTDLWSGEEQCVHYQKLHLFAMSFGGPAGLLLSSDPRVDKVIAVSPVVDWSAPSKAEPMDWLYGFVRRGFGYGYRFSKREWEKLKKGNFYNPTAKQNQIDGSKVLIIHARDDKTVLYGPVEKFAKSADCRLLILKRGGHLSSTVSMRPHVYKKVKAFLDQKK